MDAAFYDLLIVLSSSAGLILLGAIGIWALPWSDKEFDETMEALVELKRLSIMLFRRARRPSRMALSLRAPGFRPPISLAPPIIYADESTVP